MANILDILENEIRKIDKYLDNDKKVIKAKVQEDAINMNSEFLQLLTKNNDLKKAFFKEIDGFLIFDKVLFSWVLSNKEFLPGSYTRYKNLIGLSSGNNILKHNQSVVLDFPFKDCVLIGDQINEEEKRSETFYNSILLKDDIDTLLDPKVFTNSFKYSLEESTTDFKPTLLDNYIIKGNNLIALYSLLPVFEGKIKLIVIDPPYNTGNDGFKYNDNFNHSSWLVFMKNRLEVCKRLLTDDGSIYVQMDVKEAHYLKVLLDEVFGRENFRSEIIWDTSIPYVAGNKWLSPNWIYSHSVIFYYAKNKSSVFFNKQHFEVQQPSGDISKKPYKDVWTDIENFAGFLGAKDIRLNFNTRKPEHLLERIIKSSSKEGDFVLDCFLGSGTTCAVAHKMNRRYIGIEQMDYIKEVSVGRLKEVINGDPKGISKLVSWERGGSFIYTELKMLNQDLINKIKKSNNNNIDSIFNSIINSPFLIYQIDKYIIIKHKKAFDKLSIEDKKKFLYEILDKNMIYVNYSDLKDENLHVTNAEEEFTKTFYGEILL